MHTEVQPSITMREREREREREGGREGGRERERERGERYIHVDTGPGLLYLGCTHAVTTSIAAEMR